MSTVDYNYETNGVSIPQPAASPSDGAVSDDPGSEGQVDKSSRQYHRLHEVRQQQGASLRSISRRLNLTVQEARELEDPRADLRISDLLKWQKILEVPLADLLVDSDGPLSEPVNSRARMLRIMKTAKAIQESAHECGVKRLSNMLIGQLVQMMPELAEVSAWHSVGQRRTQDEVGRIVERSIPDNFFNDPSR
jgi:transcriptional regulator with XRE-family HTH domain